ncbi:MAG TPA: hypothetical protein VLI07_18820 [Candidatus Binatus sp.]|nr:hypothetical protein [Candidatus Binatus sp.]
MRRLLELGFGGPEEMSTYWDGLSEHFDRDGEPITMRQWGMLAHDRDYKVVKQEHVGPYFVSTVWLGLDHSFGRGPPIVFETMVFKEDRTDLECWRYATEAEAVEGHQLMCEQVRLVHEATS